MQQAKMIFLEGLKNEKNCQAGFRKEFEVGSVPEATSLRITARTFYRAFINGAFLFYGPARAAHRCARIDTLDVTGRLVKGRNILAIEVAGYNDANLYVTGEYSFLLAELSVNGEVVAATDKTWTGIKLVQKKQDVRPFSHARCVSEEYDLDDLYFDWRSKPDDALSESLSPVEEIDDELILQERAVALADFRKVCGAQLLTVSNRINDTDIGFKGRVESRPGSEADESMCELRIESGAGDTSLEFDFG